MERELLYVHCIHKCIRKLQSKIKKSLTELTTITAPSERTLASLSERSLLSSKIHGVALEIHDSILVILDHNVNFISTGLFDITISSWPAVQGTRWLGTHDTLHRGWQFLLQIWTLNNHRGKRCHMSQIGLLRIDFHILKLTSKKKL